MLRRDRQLYGVVEGTLEAFSGKKNPVDGRFKAEKRYPTLKEETEICRQSRAEHLLKKNSEIARNLRSSGLVYEDDDDDDNN